MSEAHQPGQGFQDAIAFAIEVHGKDVRKGDPELPYVSHLLGVASLVMEDGGTEAEAIGALLHDTAEDHGGEAMLATVLGRFGAEVEAIVRACSDSLLEEGAVKEDWRPRKERYLAALEAKTHAGALRVSNADKLHNARAILADFNRIGSALWQRFTTKSGADQAWYYGELARIFSAKRPDSRLAHELAATVHAITVAMDSTPRDEWLAEAIATSDEYAHAMLDDFEQERAMAQYATSDYDFVLVQRDFGDLARETAQQLERERARREDLLAQHRQRWADEF